MTGAKYAVDKSVSEIFEKALLEKRFAHYI